MSDYAFSFPLRCNCGVVARLAIAGALLQAVALGWAEGDDPILARTHGSRRCLFRTRAFPSPASPLAAGACPSFVGLTW
jgi:hypothetical protein